MFVAVESRLANPMFPLRILRVPGLAASSVVRGFLVTGMFSTFLLGVLYLQHVHGYGALRDRPGVPAADAGPGAALARRDRSADGAVRALAGPAGGPDRDHRRADAALAPAGAQPTTSRTIFVPFALLGLGAGLSFLPLTTIAMAEVPLGDAGLASGIVNASLQISAAIGTAALGTVAAERTKVLAGLGQHHLQALTGGFHLAWALGAGAVAVGALVTLLWLRPPARPDEVTADVTQIEEHDLAEFELEAA